jgi:hypothetical protein
MPRKLIDYRVVGQLQYKLADLERYVPIIERSVFLNDPSLTQFLVINNYRLNAERRSREGRMRLTNTLLDGINRDDPYRHRDTVDKDTFHPGALPPYRAVRRDSQFVQKIFVAFLNWLSRSGYRYVQDPTTSWDLTGDDSAKILLLGDSHANVLYNPMQPVGNCENVARGFAMTLICVGVPKREVELAYVQATDMQHLFAYNGAVAAKASRKGAIFFQTTVPNSYEYRSRIMIADGDGFVAGPTTELDSPFGDHYVVKAAGSLWDGNYACRYDEPSQVCEVYSYVKLRGEFIDHDEGNVLVPEGDSPGFLVEVSGDALAADVKQVTGHADGRAYVFVKPGAPGCHVDVPSDKGRFSVPLRVAREWGYVVPTGWDRGNVQAEAFVKNAVATAIVKYRDDTSFWNSKSAETDGFLKSAVRWIGEDDGRCKSVKAKFFAKDDLTKVPKLPEHSSYRDLYHVLGFDPTGEQAVPKSVVGKRLRGFLLNAFKVPEHIKAAAGA